MSVTRTTSVSWFGRLKQSVMGVLFGIVLVIGSPVGLFWNEGRAVTTARSLDEGAGAVVTLDRPAVDAAKDGRLVHISGPVTTQEVLEDDGFGISAKGLRLVRTAEMYQWKQSSRSETRTKLGGGQETVTTYTYAKEWSSRAVDSSQFEEPEGHANPSKEYEDQTLQVSQARLGEFSLGEEVLNDMRGGKALRIEAGQLQQVRAAYGGSSRVAITDGKIYIGANPASPRIGDYKISYEIVPVGTFSIIGRQTEETLTPYQTRAGDRLLLVASGAVPASQMFADAQDANAMLTWIIRVVGMVLLFVGFTMLMAPLAVAGDVLPIFGSIVRLGSGVVSFVLAAVLGTITIAVAWFFFRPLLAALLVGAGLLVAAAVIFIGRQRKAQSAFGA